MTCLIHQAIYSGLTTVVMAKFEIEKFCSTIQDQRITFAYIVPPVVLLLAKHPIVDKYDLSSLRMLNSGAAPLTEELVEAVYKRLKAPIKQGYGLSETSPSTHTQVSLMSHDHMHERLLSCTMRVCVYKAVRHAMPCFLFVRATN